MSRPRMEVCPSEVVLAPPDRIWHFLTDPRELARWSGTRLVDGPGRAVSPGDRLVLRAGLLPVTFDVVDMQAPTRLTVDVVLPFGVTNHEQIQITPIDATSARVTFN